MNAVSDVARAVVRLRRDGQAPLRFFGHCIGRHDGRHPQVRVWHDLGLYQLQEGGFATEIVARSLTGPSRCHAIRSATLDDAVAILEAHDPCRDLCPGVTTGPLDLSDLSLSAATLAQQAVELRALGHDLERSYFVAVGAFLARLAV